MPVNIVPIRKKDAPEVKRGEKAIPTNKIPKKKIPKKKKPVKKMMGGSNMMKKPVKAMMGKSMKMKKK